MADDHIIDIRRYLGQSPGKQDEGAFAVWGGGEERSRFALPLWRAIYLAGGDWGGIVSLSKEDDADGTRPLFILDLKQDPARIYSPTGSLHHLRGEDAPALAFSDDQELAVLLGEDDDRRWFLQILGVASRTTLEGKGRENLLFLAGECAGLLFFHELATPLPSSASTP